MLVFDQDEATMSEEEGAEQTIGSRLEQFCEVDPGIELGLMVFVDQG